MHTGNSHGYSVLELLVVLGMAGIFMAVAVTNLHELDDPLLNGTSELVGFLKQVRARSFASTSAYTISPNGPNQLRTVYAKKCSDVATTPDNKLHLDFPTGVRLTDTNWSLCISSRGLPNANRVITLQDNAAATRQVEIMLGGAVRVVP